MKTDIYAIGGLLHWLLFRISPNAGLRCEDALAETLSGRNAEVPTNKVVPDAFISILKDTLRKSPIDRTITVSRIVTKLETAAEQTS